MILAAVMNSKMEINQTIGNQNRILQSRLVLFLEKIGMQLTLYP
jgi:hypothetical protein